MSVLSFRASLVLAAGILAAASPAFAALSFDDALHLAQQRSHQLPAQQAAASAAREMAVAAGQRPDPMLKAGINNLPVDGPDRWSLTRDFMTMRSIGIAQEFTRADKLKARSERFEHEALAAEAGRELALANLQRDTAIAWLDRYHQERLRALLASQRDEARLQIDAADAAYRGARGPQVDVFAARAALALMDDRIAQTDRQIATAKTMLARWVGAAANEPLADPPLLASVAFHPDTLEHQLADHPELALLVRREQIAQADVDLARSNMKSDISVELMFSQRGPAYSNMVSLNVALPLQWDQSNRQQRELAARLATLEQLRAEREETMRMHIAEATAMWQEWQSNAERRTRYDTTLIPLAGQRTQAALAAYRGASGSLTAVLEARRSEIDIRIERLRFEMDNAKLWAQLSFLIPARHADNDKRVAP